MRLVDVLLIRVGLRSSLSSPCVPSYWLWQMRLLKASAAAKGSLRHKFWRQVADVQSSTHAQGALPTSLDIRAKA